MGYFLDDFLGLCPPQDVSVAFVWVFRTSVVKICRDP